MIMTEQELQRVAENFLPYDTHPDKFTRDMRNGVIDMCRKSYIAGAEFILNNPQIVCRKFK